MWSGYPGAREAAEQREEHKYAKQRFKDCPRLLFSQELQKKKDFKILQNKKHFVKKQQICESLRVGNAQGYMCFSSFRI